MVLLISNDVTERVLSMRDALAAVEDAFTQLGRGDAIFQPRTDLVLPTATRGEFYVWGSLIGAITDPPRLAFRFKSDIVNYKERDGDVTVEWFNVEPGTFMGFVFLFDTVTGELLAMMNDGELQHVRVAATAGVACKYLSQEGASVVGLLGSGGMARAYAKAFAAVRDVDQIRVFSPTQANREAFAAEMSEQLGIDVTPVGSGEAAVRGADIVASCTDARTPALFGEWLEDGMFVTNVSHAEINDDVYSTADRVFTTGNDPVLDYVVESADVTRESYRARRGHRNFERSVYPTLAAVLAGDHPPRESASETIFYHNMSAGIQFAAVGNLVYEGAADRSLGTTIPLDWFQQDVRN